MLKTGLARMSFLQRTLVLITILCSGEAVRILPRTSNGDDSSPVGGVFHDEREMAQVHVDIPDSPDGHLVKALPLLDSSLFTTKQWAGHLPASPDKDKYFFYWLFEPDQTGASETVPDKDIPLLIWLNGGPACSSMDGLFIENGPFRFVMDEGTKEYRLVPDEHSWHKLPAYTLYIDQPVGTGLSFTTTKKYPSNDAELNKDFYYFLQEFLKFHNDKFVTNGADGKKTMNRKLFFSGESYAGHYNVIYSNHILKQNHDLLDGDVSIIMGGAAIGNGWVDPYYQYAGAEAAYGHGLIGSTEVAAFNQKEISCQQQLAAGNYNVNVCFSLIDDIIANSHGKSANSHASSYDIRVSEVKGKPRAFPPGHNIIENYLGNQGHNLPGTIPTGTTAAALKALHAEASTQAKQIYLECTNPPYYALAGSDGKGVVPDMVEILEHPDEVELLFFNGIMDMVCNHVGNERSLQHLPWKHNEDWNIAPRYAWRASSEAEGKVSGYMREFGTLKFLKINSAGHMVPLDVPGVAFDMMKTFVFGKSFKDSLQNLKRSKVTECPVCPECPDGSDARVPGAGSGNENASGGASASWLLVLGVLVVGVAMGFSVSRQRQHHQDVLARAAVHNDVEMRETAYTDEPEKEGNGVI